uniref:Uncharacterized protein n=1 Tax=Arundo donax TaxID=35708 RepID=A0A0A9D9C3_ARUDO
MVPPPPISSWRADPSPPAPSAIDRCGPSFPGDEAAVSLVSSMDPASLVAASLRQIPKC